MEGSPSAAKILRLPFDQLPNLPKPVIPELDLNIDMLQTTPSSHFLVGRRRIGYHVRDKSCQTDQSEMLDLKRVTMAMQNLSQDVLSLRKDLSYAQNVMKADYQAKITERATTLYCRMNKRLKDVEKSYREKISLLRNSYKTQLSDAVKKIAGEYKAYYEELLSGKSDRHDIIIKQLKEQTSEMAKFLEEKESQLEIANLQLKQSQMMLQNEEDKPIVIMETPPTGAVSEEEHYELQETMGLLQQELADLQVTASSNEATIRKLRRDNDGLNKQLSKEKEKFSQMKNDFDAFKKKTLEEQSRASRLAESQLVALEKEMKEQMEKEKEQELLAQQQHAEMEKMQSEARHLQEIAQRKAMEEKMAQEMNTMSEQDALMALQTLQKVEAKQKKEIKRLEHELDRTNRAWEMKLTIMQRNFHAIKDEAFIRHSLQRQAATLHHATVGYAVQGLAGNEERVHSNFPKAKPLVSETTGTVQRSGRTSSAVAATGLSSLSSFLIPPAPSPSPSHMQWRHDTSKGSLKSDSGKASRAVQFDNSSNS
ncbi:uncharacterized protein C10orf67, mitochondrial-like [Dysidea avara]|uniref:uncharacterized protein C10orf67, mitochondrial-like n=1 Tax=Dysidea avara TaxID=196820 RepID=UPI00332B5DCE